tara:strand:- start:1692 stop:1928 length:237 start_codon:yes stop_codon:yes gene_type:complete
MYHFQMIILQKQSGLLEKTAVSLKHDFNCFAAKLSLSAKQVDILGRFEFWPAKELLSRIEGFLRQSIFCFFQYIFYFV